MTASTEKRRLRSAATVIFLSVDGTVEHGSDLNREPAPRAGRRCSVNHSGRARSNSTARYARGRRARRARSRRRIQARSPPSLRDQERRGLGGAAGGEQVIDDNDAPLSGECVADGLRATAVPYSSVVALAHGLVRQLALLARDREPDSQSIGHRRADYEAARFDAEHHVRRAEIGFGNLIDDRSQSACVGRSAA